MTEPSPFFITGLPRSRTAWAANFFCAGRISCRHEYTAFLTDPAHVLPALRRLPGRFVGTADTAAPLYLERIRNEFPDIPFVILERDPDEVEKSLKAVLWGLYESALPETYNGHHAPAMSIYSALDRIPATIGILSAALARIRILPNVIPVPWERLNEAKIVREIQEHIAPGEKFDHGRFEMLKDFRIEITPARWQGLLRIADVLAKR